METNIHELSSIDSFDRDGLDPEAVRDAIRAHGEEIKQRELQRAFNRLESNGEFTSEQREIIRQMAIAIVDRVLAAPDAALEDGQEYTSDTVRTAVELFEPDQ